jgi:hypothetical protein
MERTSVFDHTEQQHVFQVSDALEALRELEGNTAHAILGQRASERIEVRTPVTLRPGNSSQRHEYGIQGLTGDISSGGCQILSSRPLHVGDIYWLTFSEEHLSIGSLLARCLRTRMIREDTFESGFRFLHDVDLAGALKFAGEHVG